MIRDEDIEDLKKHLDQNGKLIISDDLPPAKKERFEFINSLNIDLVEVLSRKTEVVNDEEDEEIYVSNSLEEDENNESSNSFNETEDSSVESLSGVDDTVGSFTENDNVSVDDLNNIF